VRERELYFMTHQEQNDLLIEPRERKRGEKKERKETSCMKWQRTGQQGNRGRGQKISRWIEERKSVKREYG